MHANKSTDERRLLYLASVYPYWKSLFIEERTGEMAIQFKSGVIRARFRISAMHGRVQLYMAVPKSFDDISSLTNAATSYIERLVSFVSFAEGMYFQIVVDELIDLDQVNLTLLESDVEWVQKLENRTDFARIANATTGPDGAKLASAIRDFNLAMQYAEETAFFCYRSLETIMHYFERPDGSGVEALSWDRMHGQLGTSKGSIINKIKNFADEPRHGKLRLMDASERKEALTYTYRAIQAFIEHLSEQPPDTSWIETLRFQ